MRHYRTAKGFWGFGFGRSPGGWWIWTGRHVLTTEPE